MKKAEYKTRRSNITVYEDGTFEGTVDGKKITSDINKKGYVIITYPMFHGRLHRIIWQLFHPEHKLLPTEDIHHINGIKTDNSLENLQCIDHNKHAILTANEPSVKQAKSDFWKISDNNPNKWMWNDDSIKNKIKETKRKKPWHPTEETYQKWQECRVGRKWCNNGKIEMWVKGEIPNGFVQGRIKSVKEKISETLKHNENQ